MASLVQELLIKVGIKSDTAQGKDAAASVERIGNAVKATAPEMQKAGTASKDMARGIGEGAAAGNAAVAAMSQVSAASQGGAQGMLALARAGFAAGVSMKAVMASMGPLGAVAAAIGIALGVVSLALKRSEDSAGAARAKLDEINKANLEAVKTQLGNVADEAKRFKDELEAAARANDRISDAKLADKLATIKASDLTPQQKERAEVDVRRAREDEKRADAQKLLDDKADADARTAARFAQIEIDKETEEKIEVGKKARLEAAKAALPASRIGAAPGNALDLSPSVDAEKVARAIAARAELAAAKRDAGPDVDASIKAAGEARLAATEDRRKADEAAAAAAAIAKRERDTQREEYQYITNARKQTDKAELKKAPLTPQQQAAQDLSDLKAKEMFPSDYRGRIASGIPVDREQLKRIYPGEAFPEAAPRLQGAPSGGTIQTSDVAKIQVNAKPLEKGIKEGNDKTRAAIDAELAKVATSVAAQSVALTTTAAATSTLAAAQAAMQATVAQMQSQISNMRTN